MAFAPSVWPGSMDRIPPRHRFGHIGTGVDGHHQNRRRPHIGKLHVIVGEVGQSVVHKHCLEHHGRAPEHLHIHPHDAPDQRQEKPLYRVVVLRVRVGLQNAADKADDTADDRGHQGQDQRVFHAAEIGAAVFFPELHNISAQLTDSFHIPASPF